MIKEARGGKGVFGLDIPCHRALREAMAGKMEGGTEAEIVERYCLLVCPSGLSCKSQSHLRGDCTVTVGRALPHEPFTKKIPRPHPTQCGGGVLSTEVLPR